MEIILTSNFWDVNIKTRGFVKTVESKIEVLSAVWLWYCHGRFSEIFLVW